jgi:hypothetical protein
VSLSLLAGARYRNSMVDRRVMRVASNSLSKTVWRPETRLASMTAL